MINLRYFTSKAKYFVTERAYGLRNLSNIDFYIGYDSANPTPRVAATSTQSAAAAAAAATGAA